MKKPSFLSMLIVLCQFALPAQEPNMEPYHLAMEQPYKEGEVIVKFRDDQIISFQKSAGLLSTGRSVLDAKLAQWSVHDASQVFRNTTKQNETRINVFPDGTEKPLPQFHNIFLLSFPENNDPVQLAEALGELEEVEYAEPNLTFFITGTQPRSPLLNEEDLPKASNRELEGIVPNDPLYSQQWYLPHINADLLWHTQTGDTTQVIAILDTGVDYTHPDLQNKIWQNPGETLNGQDSDGNGFVDDIRGWDFVNNNNNPMDDNSHGTHCAGLAAAETDNGIGIAGVSWGARIMPVKVFHSAGFGYTSQIAEGIWYAAENGATIFSNSWGGTGESITIRLAFEYAYFHGPIVASAGNSGHKTDYPFPPWPPTVPVFPACYNWVIGVEATNEWGGNAWFSNFDPTGPILSDDRPYGGFFYNYRDFNYEVRAPGMGLLSTVPNGQYRSYSGTSMAAPLVAGTIALMKSHQPDLSNEAVFVKLIQPVKINMFLAGVLDVYECVMTDPPPDLYYVSHHITDTINGGNGDGQPNPGETIEIFPVIKNAGGWGENIMAELRFNEFEDQSVADILQNTIDFGSISEYGTLTAQEPFLVSIAEDVAHARIIDLILRVWQEGETDTLIQALPVTVRRGIEISGVYEGLLHLEDDGYYVVTGPAVIDSLIIEPGLTLRFSNNSFLMITQYMYAVGEPHNMITFMGDVDAYVQGVSMAEGASSRFEYCIFQDGWGYYGGPPYLLNPQVIHHSVFRYNHDKHPFNLSSETDIKYNLFTENAHFGYGEHNYIMIWGTPANFKYNILTNHTDDYFSGATVKFYSASHHDLSTFSHNVFINNKKFSVGTSNWNGWPMGTHYLPAQYWGHTDPGYVKQQIGDYYFFSDRAALEPDSILEKPPAEAHGVVWKVELNEENPMYGNMNPVGAGPLRFDVYFNRPMDVEHTPLVTFGIRYPYTQHLVNDNASWSADSLVWTAYHTMTLNSGDGLNTVRVAHARDTEGFEIPIERSRFRFSVQVAGSQAIEFNAEPKVGRVRLEWPPTEDLQILGHNMYRYQMKDTLSTDTLMLNTVLITDPYFVDHEVMADSTYFYMFTMVNTNLEESAFSKVVSATPYAAATGDANGDYFVNVLDITTIVSYILDEDPKPFIFEAADVNADQVINVLDIVGLVELIMGSKDKISPIVQTHPEPALIHFDKHTIRLESNGQVSALQFELHTKYPELLQLTSTLPGYELATSITVNGIRGILFNMHGNTIPGGLTDIIRMEHPNYDLEWGALTGACPDGRYVEILTTPLSIDPNQPLPVDFHMELYPNPATSEVTVRGFLPARSDVFIDVYDLLGRRLYTLNESAHPPGEYAFHINTSRFGNTNGLVLVRMSATSTSGQLYDKTVRLMLIP